MVDAISIHRSNDHMLETHHLDRFGDSFRLFQIQLQRFPLVHCAVATSPGADISQNHEGGHAMIPALPHIGTLGFFANRIQLQPSQKPL
jgi:hypothetical protein